MDVFTIKKVVKAWKTLVISKKLRKVNMKLVFKFLRYKNAKLFLKWVKQNKDLQQIKKKALNLLKNGEENQASFLTIQLKENNQEMV